MQTHAYYVPQTGTWTPNEGFARTRSRRYLQKSIVRQQLSDKKVAKFKPKFN